MKVFGQEGIALVLLGGLALLAAGCGSGASTGGPSKDRGARDKQPQAAREEKGHDHSGWWCDEHGVPEAECSMCSARVAAEFKKKGDWCDKHDRARSQCFLCDPSLKEKYAAIYRAKYGKEPPPTEDEEKDRKDRKDAKK